MITPKPCPDCDRAPTISKSYAWQVSCGLGDQADSKSACDECGRCIGQIHEILDGVCELCRDPGAHDAMLASIEEDRACLAYRERFMCDD